MFPITLLLKGLKITSFIPAFKQFSTSSFAVKAVHPIMGTTAIFFYSILGLLLLYRKIINFFFLFLLIKVFFQHP